MTMVSGGRGPDASGPDTDDSSLILRHVVDEDLDVFFEYQTDPEANRMAAFTAKDPTDRETFDAHWAKIRSMDSVTIRTIEQSGTVVGSVLSYVMEDTPEVSYWIGRRYWGQGFATWALREFLQVQTARPLLARAAKDNVASLCVLKKCGFVVTGTERGYAEARGEEIEEFVLRFVEPPASL